MVRPSLPMFRILLVTAFIATHAHAECVANETCCFEGEYQLSLSDTYEDYEDADPLVYTTPSWMRTCLQSVMMEGAKAQATITILRNVLLETYSFSDLVRNSADTNSSVEGYYADRFQVHSIAVPAVSLLQDVLEAASSDTPDDDDRVSSYTFHYGVAEVFRQLYDGHTQYSTPFVDWGLYRIVTLRPELNSDGDQVYVLKAMPGWEEGGFGSDFFTPERYESVHGVPLEEVSVHEGKRVERVNGVAVEEYVQARADSLGGIKSASGRVNNLLNSDYEPGMEMLYGMPPPESDLETFEFYDGTSATWHLTVAYSGGATGREDLEAAYGASEAYDTFRNVFQAVVEKYEEIWEESCPNCNPYDDYGGARRSSSPSSSPGNATIASRMERWSAVLRDVAPELKRAFDSLPAEGKTAPLARRTMSDVVGRRRSLQQMDGDECDVEECEEFVDYDYADFTDEEAVEVASNVMQVQLFWAGEAKANGTAFLGVYHVEAEAEGVDDAMVLKLNTFSPEYGAWAPMQGSSAGDTKPFFKALTQAMERADSYAQENNIPNLILDMSANGGGWTAGIFYALRLVMNGWTEWSDICDAAFLKVSDLGNFFSEAGEYALLEILEEAEGEEVADAGEEILDIIGTIESMGALLSNVTEELYLNSTVFDDVASLREAMQSEEGTVDEKRALMREYLTTKVEELSHGPITLLAAQGKYSLSTEEPFQGIDWYKESRTRAFRGGATVEYTQQFIADCPEALAAFAEIHNGDAQAVAHSFEKVIVLTDGTCGSACSTFATRLMLSGGVKSVTYGGLLGVEMDSSAFGGGNVYDWITYSRESVIAYFVNLMLGHIPDPDDTVGDMDITDVPVPLPSGASVRFTVDNTLEPYLGPNSLPREFYSIPADVHLPMWAPGAGNFPIVPEGSTEAVHTNIVPVWKATLSEFSDAPVLTAWRRKDWDFASGCAANCADDSPSTTTPSPTLAPTAPSTPSPPAPPSSTPSPNPNPNPTPSPPLTPTPSPTPSPNPNPNPNPTTSPPVTPTPSPTPGTDSDDSAATPLRNSSQFAMAYLFLLSLSAAVLYC